MIRKQGLNMRLLLIGGTLSVLVGYGIGRRHERWVAYRAHIKSRLRAIKLS